MTTSLPFESAGRRSGLTVLGLVIWIILIGALIAVTVEIVTSKAEQKYDAIVTAELERLAAAEASYRSTNGRYADSLGLLSFKPQDQVAISLSGTGLQTGTGWAATARHASSPDRKCVIGVGADSIVGGMHTRPGVVKCE
jgi:hypothetical protein